MEIISVEAFLNYYEKVRKRTNRIIAYIPPEKLEWTYREGKFTLGDLVRHLAAIERHMYAENALFKPSLYTGCGTELADGYDETIRFFEDMHRESMAIFAALTMEDMQQKTKTPAGTPITLWKWLRLMIEHEIHHRGQIYLYLAMLNVKTPPLYGLTAEELAERSAKQ